MVCLCVSLCVGIISDLIPTGIFALMLRFQREKPKIPTKYSPINETLSVIRD